jgi:hypothetical protein
VNHLRAVAAACLLAFSAAGALAEDEHVPEPYAPEEFPAWANDLRRAEIVFFGSLPFSLFFTFEAYDIGRFVGSGFDEDGFDTLLAPWPFRAGSEIGARYSTAEKGWLIASALTVSLCVSVVDFLIVHRPEKREDR